MDDITKRMQSEIDAANAECVRLAEALKHVQGENGKLMGEIAALNIEQAGIRGAALEEAALACENERLDEGSESDGDRGYDMAIKHVAAAIRDLKVSPPAAKVQGTATESQLRDAVTILRGALVNAECAIKGREHTGFITKALVATDFASSIAGAASEVPPLPAPAEGQSDAERIAHLEAEEELSNAVIGRLARVLAAIAITLKGPEFPLHRHGYSDLAELVVVLQLEVELYRAQASGELDAPASSGATAPAEPQKQADLSKRLRGFCADTIVQFPANDLRAAADEIERLTTAKSHLIQQAQIWHMEATGLRATVLSILQHFGLPENDWEAKRLVVDHIDKLTCATAIAPSKAAEGSIGDDRKFCRLARAWDTADHTDGPDPVATWEAFVAYTDSVILARIAAVGMSEWISVEDELPSTAPLANGHVPTVVVHWKRGALADNLSQVDTSNTVFLAYNKDKFTHWMPFPEAPPLTAQVSGQPEGSHE